uniref:Phorbol-ester/DAG-type domain-containing protein n=1 Tax=Heligmosomoides polygyrus TaxID=6339 RepID=A0A8L8JT12_HELPZ
LQRSRGRRNPYCEVCMSTIWRMVQSWRRCKACGLRAHDKCASEVHRVCAGVVASRRDFRLATAICEERGLCAQDYACAECEAPLSYEGPANMHPRLCEYTGLLFCSKCHWNDTWSIPARIFHNMDAKPRPVCRAAKQLLAIVDSRPLIDLSECSVFLQNAAKLRILQYLNRHQHFVEGADMYSLAELRELCTGNLLRDLEDIHTVFRRHIEEECEICAGNGFYCELCEDQEQRNQLIFPFSENVSMCPQCLAVFHSKCFEKRSSACTRCERRRKRADSLRED